MRTRFEIRRLTPGDDRRLFSCGNIDLDRFFQRYAGQNQFRHHIGTTYVTVEREHILGFATVCASQLELDALPESHRRRLPSYPLPVLRLARLGVSVRARGRGVGLALLRFVLKLALRMADDVGCIGVLVDTKPGAAAFYERYGFMELNLTQGMLEDRPQPRPMFLLLREIPKGVVA